MIGHARTHDAVPENDRLVRTLRSMGWIMQTEGKVEFRGDAYAERFADELRQRYGKWVVADLATGQTDALAGDFEDEAERRWIARAVASAAKSHVAFGPAIRELRGAATVVQDEPGRHGERDWEW